MNKIEIPFRLPSLNQYINECRKNKFAGANLTPAFRHNIPYVDEANFVLLCNKLAAVPIEQCHLLDQTLMSKWYQDSDMHTMYVVEIIESLCR